VGLARLALGAALTVTDVVRAQPGLGGTFVTVDVPVALRGVTVVAEPDGRYGVALRLVARPVPLRALGETVRERVLTLAGREGLAAAIARVDVDFVDVAVPGEEPPSPAAAPGPASPVAVPAPAAAPGAVGSPSPLAAAPAHAEEAR